MMNCYDFKRHPTWNCPIFRFFELVSVVITVCLLYPLLSFVENSLYRIIIFTVPIVFLAIILLDLTLSICFLNIPWKFWVFIALTACLSYLAVGVLTFFAVKSFPFIVIVAIIFLFITGVLFLYEVIRLTSLFLGLIVKRKNKKLVCEACRAQGTEDCTKKPSKLEQGRPFNNKVDNLEPSKIPPKKNARQPPGERSTIECACGKQDKPSRQTQKEPIEKNTSLESQVVKSPSQKVPLKVTPIKDPHQINGGMIKQEQLKKHFLESEPSKESKVSKEPNQSNDPPVKRNTIISIYENGKSEKKRKYSLEIQPSKKIEESPASLIKLRPTLASKDLLCESFIENLLEPIQEHSNATTKVDKSVQAFIINKKWCAQCTCNRPKTTIIAKNPQKDPNLV